MAQVPRSERAVHDQIIGHDLIGLDERTLLALLIVELRKLRQDLHDRIKPFSDDGT